MVQALFLHSQTSEFLPLCILGRNSLYLSCQCPTALGTATSVPSCLSELSTQLRTFGGLSRCTCCPRAKATTSEVFQRSLMTQLL